MKRSWVLHECLERVPEDFDAMHELLKYGLRGTDVEAMIALGNRSDNGKSVAHVVFVYVYLCLVCGIKFCWISSAWSTWLSRQSVIDCRCHLILITCQSRSLRVLHSFSLHGYVTPTDLY